MTEKEQIIKVYNRIKNMPHSKNILIFYMD